MTAAGIDSAFEGSDHCPIWMDVELPQELPQGHPVPAMALQHRASGAWLPHADERLEGLRAPASSFITLTSQGLECLS